MLFPLSKNNLETNPSNQRSWQTTLLHNIPLAWRHLLNDEFDKPYMHALISFLEQEDNDKQTIYPKKENIFFALEQTPFDHIKVVILGQDPYHGPGQAHGLSFSVEHNQPLPPSLKNIYKELEQEYNKHAPSTGCLTPWAQQGVLLLNNTLTVRHKQAGSHQHQGWEIFTDKIIQHINSEKEHIVFILWGKHAQQKGHAINREKHLVLEAPHPSPLSAYRGFLGCNHFKKANLYLEQNNIAPIMWLNSLSER